MFSRDLPAQKIESKIGLVLNMAELGYWGVTVLGPFTVVYMFGTPIPRYPHPELSDMPTPNTWEDNRDSRDLSKWDSTKKNWIHRRFLWKNEKQRGFVV